MVKGISEVPLPRPTARRLTRTAQLATAGALAIALIVLFLPRHRPRVSEVEPAELPPASGGAAAAADADASPSPPADWTLVAADLSRVRMPLDDPADTAAAGQPDAALASGAADPAASTPDGAPGSASAEPAPPGWQYIGFARDAVGAMSALVAVNGVQRFIRAGATTDSYSVESISPTAVLLARDDRHFEIKIKDPLPFNISAAHIAARATVRSAQVRGRNAQLEQQRRRDLEAQRARQGAGDPGQPEQSGEQGGPGR